MIKIGLARPVALLLLLASNPAFGQSRYTIEYTVSMPQPASHLYEIAMHVSGLTSGPVELQLPVWSPGR
jgi:hypothetical protein